MSTSVPDGPSPLHRRALIAIVLASALLRISYYLDLRDGPCLEMHRVDQFDMNFFDVWARHLLAGDWLTSRGLHPFHNWHRRAANEFFATYAPGTPGDEDERGRRLWNHWYRDKVFHQEPLYPYLVALTYATLGDDVRWVYAWQAALGVAANLLVYLITRRCFGGRAGLVAAALAVLCGPLLLYDLTLLRETPIVAFGLGLVLLTAHVWPRRTWPPWLLTGIAVGLAVLLKATFLLFLAGVLVALLERARREPAAAARSLAALGAGVLIALSPAIARNLRVGAPAFSLSSVGAVTFLTASAEDVQPELGYVHSAYIPHVLARTDGALVATVRETLSTHAERLGYLRQLAGKLAMAWHGQELPDNVNFYYYRLYSRVLRLLPVTFVFLAPWGLLGLFLAIPRGRECWPLYLLVGSSLFSLLVFYVSSRLRLPLAAGIIPFAAFALVRTVEWARARRVAPALAAIAAVGLVSLWTSWPLSQWPLRLRFTDFYAGHVAYYDPEVDKAVADNDWGRAAALLGRSLHDEPSEIRRLGPARLAANATEAELARWFAEVHLRRAQALRNQERLGEASAELRRVIELRDAAGEPRS